MKSRPLPTSPINLRRAPKCRGAVGLHGKNLTTWISIGMEAVGPTRGPWGPTWQRACGKRGLSMLHTPAREGGGASVAFNPHGVHPHDVSTILDFHNIAIRAGHHCAQQLHRALGCHPAPGPRSPFYNTKEEADRLVEALVEMQKMLGCEG